MSFFSEIFGGSKTNPANAAMPFLQQIPGTVTPQLDPFRQFGLRSGGNIQSIAEMMSKDPVAFMNNIMSQYQESPGFKFKKDQLLKQAGNTAAAGGMRGTGQDVFNEDMLTNSLMSQDMQQWLQNSLGILGTGLGEENQLFNTGFNASSDLANILGSNLTQEGGLAFQGQAQQNENANDLLRALLQGGGSLFSSLMSGA